MNKKKIAKIFLKIESRCVCCGALVPEGMMVCPTCRANAKKAKKDQESVAEENIS